ncbi:MAG: tsaE [Ferruginibacter sp.]|uniref:tRNA (adenosine(37)-N6)-threonylcarbamoyltransferase complex ATPase subunit type 1 TsaE n=1 Tax=Ferruginibacter sp. TaxID=1940288 RepID=UPI00265A4153|nr:tRNA (adenosine(37)-N6)-threonylcarbamoyltransferase complex ATPase subunit type 1 TsaE [Ferruginibacter sp.]MDB5275176.1 tsaE [Ferruginibacter sp.]
MELIYTLDNIEVAAKEFTNITNAFKVFAFEGEMGAGKTTFIHALCEVAGVTDGISSPTFSIINQYITPQRQLIYHIDLYRLKNEEEAIQAGVEDCLYSGNTCFVEWPQKAPGLFPDGTLHAAITAIDTNTRKLKINL